ncbi:SGNH/GDSL hydrolase family protein [Bacillus sp. FJAT-27225]|uniref:SGNH/GDSL hydrolase family protein n=1 Tax=Bacillus sp. FJAT-27225 TaxID=1743144 RepID=UPI0011127A64|nr:SGNH/GDSL hydrolase family protein [Bacillus sp. FJAT-27225]
MGKRTVWIWTIASALFFALWFGGLAWAVADYYGGGNGGREMAKPEAEAPAAKQDKDELKLVAMGDSLTRGSGDAAGRGYVGYLMDSLKERLDEDATLVNLGINGQRSAQLAEQVKQAEVQRQLSQADIVLITIGGNDLFRSGQGLVDFESNNSGNIQKDYLANASTILTQIRSVNNDATIFLIGLYNPFIEFEEGKEMSAIIRGWNFATAELATGFDKVVFVPTFDLFELNVNDYLYTDKFHPNTEGYKLIADRVSALVKWEGEE